MCCHDRLRNNTCCLALISAHPTTHDCITTWSRRSQTVLPAQQHKVRNQPQQPDGRSHDCSAILITILRNGHQERTNREDRENRSGDADCQSRTMGSATESGLDRHQRGTRSVPGQQGHRTQRSTRKELRVGLPWAAGSHLASVGPTPYKGRDERQRGTLEPDGQSGSDSRQ